MKLKKLLKVIIIFLILLVISSTAVFATDYLSTEQFEGYDTSGVGGGIFDSLINDTLGTVLRILQVITFCVALVILMIIGIRYMTTQANEKAEVRKQVPLYLTGVVVLFGATAILRFVAYFIDDVLPAQ